MPLAPDLDDHLFEARHDGGRAEVAEVGHAIAGAEAENVACAAGVVFALQHMAVGGRVGALRDSRDAVRQWRTGELGINWLFRQSRRRIAVSADRLLAVFGFAIGAVAAVVAVAGALVLVVYACCADGAFSGTARLFAAARQTGAVDATTLGIGPLMVVDEADGLGGSRLIHEKDGGGADGQMADAHMEVKLERGTGERLIVDRAALGLLEARTQRVGNGQDNGDAGVEKHEMQAGRQSRERR